MCPGAGACCCRSLAPPRAPGPVMNASPHRAAAGGARTPSPRSPHHPRAREPLAARVLYSRPRTAGRVESGGCRRVVVSPADFPPAADRGNLAATCLRGPRHGRAMAPHRHTVGPHGGARPPSLPTSGESGRWVGHAMPGHAAGQGESAGCGGTVSRPGWAWRSRCGAARMGPQERWVGEALSAPVHSLTAPALLRLKLDFMYF